MTCSRPPTDVVVSAAREEMPRSQTAEIAPGAAGARSDRSAGDQIPFVIQGGASPHVFKT
jgi:hypothetical protein